MTAQWQSWYMRHHGVDEDEAREMALGPVRRRYAWLNLNAVKRHFHSWNFVFTMIEGRPMRTVENLLNDETAFEVQYLVVVAVW